MERIVIYISSTGKFDKKLGDSLDVEWRRATRFEIEVFQHSMANIPETLKRLL